MKPTSEQQLWAELRLAHADVEKMKVVADKARTSLADKMQRRQQAEQSLAALEKKGAALQARSVAVLADDSAMSMPEDLRVERQALRTEIANARDWLGDCDQDVADAQVIHDAALQGLHTAGSTRDKLAEAIIFEEVEQLSRTVARQYAEMCVTGEKLRNLAGTGLNIPINVAQRVFTDNVRAALARVPQKDAVYTPVSELRGAGLVQVDHWSARRAQIINELEEV